MNKTIRLLACICILLSLLTNTGCEAARGSEPMLRVMTTTGNMIFPGLKKDYYIVYENGAVKKTKEFELTKITSYSFNPDGTYEDATLLYTYSDTTGVEQLNEIANNILLLTKEPKLHIDVVGALYVLGDRYFFRVIFDNDRKRNSKLFEYLPADNTIQETASFKTGSVDYVELYEPQ